MPMKARYTVVDGEVIAEKRNGVRHLLVPDSIGSTRALLDNTQSQVATFTYWPFGEVQASGGMVTTPLQFVGTAGYYNDSSNRTYVRARYLRTDAARWQTPDPIGFDGGDYNLYRYVMNNFSTNVDETGLKCGKPPAFAPPVVPIPPSAPPTTCPSSGGIQPIWGGGFQLLLRCGLVIGLLIGSEGGHEHANDPDFDRPPPYNGKRGKGPNPSPPRRRNPGGGPGHGPKKKSPLPNPGGIPPWWWQTNNPEFNSCVSNCLT